MAERPDIVTIIGSDIKLTDKKGIENINKLNLEFANKYDLQYRKIYSNFRAFIDNDTLEGAVKELNPDYGWWHEFQHGVGLIGLVAPLSYVRGYSKVYIASSFHISQWGQYTCASDPVIDNKLKYGSTITIHDGYELTRTDKIRLICRFAEGDCRKPYLRVCWESSGGKNCCHCEKCRRTYLAILAERADPREYGLGFSKKQYNRMTKWYKRHLPYKYDKMVRPRYLPIKEAFLKNYKPNERPEGLEWLWGTEIGVKPFSEYKRYCDKIRHKLRID